MHIITLNCADDTEKKRVRYVIDKWEGEKGGLRAKGKGLRGEDGKVAEVKSE